MNDIARDASLGLGIEFTGEGISVSLLWQVRKDVVQNATLNWLKKRGLT